MIFNIFGTLAQSERRLIQERTLAGLTAARARGRKGGRPKISKHDPKVQMAKKMSKNMNISIGEICDTLKISRASIYWYFAIWAVCFLTIFANTQAVTFEGFTSIHSVFHYSERVNAL